MKRVLSPVVLVVDDDEQIEECIQEVLDEYGYVSQSFTDPVKALDFFRQLHDQVDLVITNIETSTIDGIELARQLTAIKPNLPIFFLSSDDVKLNEARLMSATRACFLKPVPRCDLTNYFERLVGPVQAS